MAEAFRRALALSDTSAAAAMRLHDPRKVVEATRRIAPGFEPGPGEVAPKLEARAEPLLSTPPA